MSPHLKNWLVTVVGICVVAAPAVWADPAVKHLIANHPGAAAYLAAAAGVVTALYRAWSMTGSKRGAG